MRNTLSLPLVAALTAAGLSAQGAGFVTSGVGCPDNGVVALPLTDDSVVTVDLGFSFGAFGNLVDVSSNGYLYANSGAFTSNLCCSANLTTIAGAPTPIIGLLGEDLNPSSAGAVFLETDNTATARITWLGVPEFGTTNNNDIQAILNADGSFMLSYSVAFQPGGNTFVGWSPGADLGGVPANDPGAADLSTSTASGAAANDMVYELFDNTTNPLDLAGSTVLFAPNGNGSYDAVSIPLIFVTPLTPVTPPFIGFTGIPAIGQNATLTVDNLPGDTIAAAALIGTTQTALPLDLLGATGCSLLVDGVFAAPAMNLAVPSATLPLTISNNPGTVGLVFQFQGAAIAPSANAFGLSMSDRGTLTIGAAPRVRVVADGANAFTGNANAGGFFRVENLGTSGLDIISVEWDCSGVPEYFDTDGNSTSTTTATGAIGQFDHGDGVTPAPCTIGNAFNGSDAVTGLTYGAPQPASACDPAGFFGWVPSNQQGTGAGNWNTVTFDFTDFQPGETFGFDCDTDGGSLSGFDHDGIVVTITFSDLSTASGTLAPLSGLVSEALIF